MKILRDSSGAIPLTRVTAAAVLGTCVALVPLRQAWAAADCASPQLPPVPLHAEGKALQLAWPAAFGATGYDVWAQWRVPEGPVVRTLEWRLAETKQVLPPSPEPWRPLMLQVEVISRCAPDAAVAAGGASAASTAPVAAGAAARTSAPSIARQLQFDPAQACPAVAQLNAPRAAFAVPARLTWQGGATEVFRLQWFDGADGKPLSTSEVQGAEAAWPVAVRPPVLVAATRLCPGGRTSAVAYLRLP